jgi:predicted methyltransferase
MKLAQSILLGGFASVILACSTVSSNKPTSIPQYIQTAVLDPRRAITHDPRLKEPDKARDANQKPAEVLTFAGVKPGFRVADFWPVPPYSTALLSAVVGPKGHVYAIVPEKVARAIPEGNIDVLNWIAPYSSNTSLLIQSFEQFAAPEPLDLVYLGKIYHDFPNEKEMGTLNIDAVNRAIFRALKPGGTYIIVDHAAVSGSGYLDTESENSKRLHRIDPEIVKRQVRSVGFVLEAESAALANPNDPHTKSAFDSSVRERTDRFIFKFRKPK